MQLVSSCYEEFAGVCSLGGLKFIEIDAGREVAAIKNSFIAGCRDLSDWLTIGVGDINLLIF